MDFHADDKTQIIYQSATTRVLRQVGTDRILKEPLGPDAPQRVQRERETLQRLAGVEGIVQLAGGVQSSVYLELQDCGIPLTQWRGAGAADICQVIALGTSLARAVAGMHRAGMIHRDICPANIVVRETPQSPTPRLVPVLIDFDLTAGTESAQAQAPLPSSTVDSLGYRAPEQSGRTGRAVDQRADLYALGVVLYELALGRRPFDSKDALQMMHDQLVLEPVPPSLIDPRVPRGLSAVILRLLAKEPEQRYQSADGLLHDLARLRGEFERGGDGDFLLGERDFGPRLPAPSPLVGRDAEVTQLRSAYDEAMRSSRHTLLIEGAPGVGKSALIDELRPLVAAANGWFLYGKFDQSQTDVEGAGAAGHALRSLGRLLLAQPKTRLELLRQRILDRLGSNASLITSMMPEFALLLGAQPDAAPLDPRQAEQRLFDTTLGLLSAIVSPESPLVLVLDDLQWAGALALRLFERLMSERHFRGLLLVGAYRGAEVAAVHPLHGLLARMNTQQQPPGRIFVDNLSGPGVAEMVGRMLRLPAGPAAALGRAVGALTGGNPFDTVETVNALRANGILRLTDEGWQWDEADIRGFIGHGSVVDMLASRVRRLTGRSRAVLEVMSCLGVTVKRALLQVAAGCDANQLEELLRVPLEEGFVVVDAGDAGDLRFRHDRVQQAVLAGLAGQARAQVQLVVGRRLATHPSFRLHTARHYLECFDLLDLLETAQERHHAARLFREMGVRLVAAANFELAQRYLHAASRLLDGLAGSEAQVDEVLRAAVDREHHLTLYSLGRLLEMDAVFARIAMPSVRALDLVEPACLQIRSLDSRGRMADALQLGTHLLLQLGVAVPPDYEDTQVESRLDALADWVRREQTGTASRPAPVSDMRLLAIFRLLGPMVRSAYWLQDSRAFVWLLLESQRLWAEHGPSATLTAVVGRLAIVLISIRQDYRTAFEVARHVLQVSEALGYEPEASDARHVFSTYACHWREPVEESVRQGMLAVQGTQAWGDLSYAAYMGLTTGSALLDCAPTLEAAEADIGVAIALSRRTSNLHAETLHRINMQFSRTMRGQDSAPHDLDQIAFEREDHVTRLRSLPFIVSLRDDNHAFAATLLGDLPVMERYTAGIVAVSQLTPAPGFYTNARTYLTVAMMRAEQLRREPGFDRTSRTDQLEECRAWLSARATDAPSNFLHLAKLVEAEQAWALDDPWRAAIAFDAALSLPDGLHRPWHRALITERAALFHLSQGMPHSGRARLAQARDLYADWGAQAKVQKMESEHPWLAPAAPAQSPARPLISSGVATELSAEALDLIGVLRASQALSSETSLDRLTSRVSEVLAALTGATRVVLLSFTDEKWSLLAPEVNGAVHSIPVAEAARVGLVPITAFRYVERTGEVLRVDDASSDDRFARDPYFAGLAHCSLLLVPIASQGTTRAIALLENRHGRAAFGAERLDAVMLIAGQLAVSLANVQLYEHLEQRVRARTEELRTTQAELIATARRAGMAEIANNVLHNVGNVLNSVNVAAAMLERNVRNSKGGPGLARVVALMKEHAPDIGGFMSLDERGRRLPGYLEQLASALDSERVEQLSELELLTRCVNHIKAVVRSQQTYAGVSTLREPVNLADLLEEALRMSADVTALHHVAVVTQIEDMPTIALDKPRLLQILVNLIANASEAMDGTPLECRKLTLAAGVRDADTGAPLLRIEVRDEGHGISSDDLPKIFAHGFTTKEGGHGFGLHSCALAAMEMGAKLGVSSDGPGTGAVFTLDLPLEGHLPTKV